jgi:hypothetical protein
LACPGISIVKSTEFGALVLMPAPFLIARRERLGELAGRHAMLTIYPSRVFADLSGLMSYGSTVLILKGAKPADLPTQ